jgi:hypothetical protein
MLLDHVFGENIGNLQFSTFHKEGKWISNLVSYP